MPSTRQRNLSIAAATVIFVAIVVLYSGPLTTAFEAIPIGYNGGAMLNETSHGGLVNETKPSTPDKGKDKKPPSYGILPTDKVSRLHYLIPASQSNLHLCYNLASSAANRYPVPTLVGYNGTGELDAHKTHLAKLRTIQRYLDGLAPEEDDDLVVVVDGYDILLQLPPEIMIERYFEVANRADARLAERFGLSLADARAQGLRQTIFWGPDKVCWPVDWSQPRCWAVPSSGLDPHAFGPNQGNGDLVFNDPRWLNSGSVIGRIDDFRAMINATMAEIDATYDQNYEFKESDQYYISNLWGRQEYFRSLRALGGKIPEGSGDRHIPKKQYEGQETEYHISIDYESALFQTKVGNEPFFDYLQFSSSGLNANMDRDMFGLGKNFIPYNILMPANVLSALEKLYNSIPDAHPGLALNEWIRTVKLGVNFVTGHIFPLWHCTGAKEFVDDEYPKMWFFPFAKSLIKASVKAFQSGEPITTHVVDGRKWLPKMAYPDEKSLHDELGGAWSDYDGGQFVEWETLCGAHKHKLFAGEEPPPPPKSEKETEQAS